MSRAFLAVSVFILLSGCATQFGTRMPHHQAQRAAPVAAPVVVPVPAPVAPETFKKRWLHKFFVKRATEK